MEEFFSFIKILASIQLIIVIGLIGLAYFLRMYTDYKRKKRQKLQQKIHQYLLDCIHQQTTFTLKLIQSHQRHLILLLEVIQQIDLAIAKDNALWQSIRHSMLYEILLPQSRPLATAKNWTKRYTYFQVLQLSFEKQDALNLKKLIEDPIPLVSINAATLALQFPSPLLVNTVIDYFSSRRRVQQSFYAQITSSANESLVPFIAHRLQREKNAYIKAFCYRILTQLPSTSDRMSTVERDLHSDTLDLKLAALSYCQYHQWPTFSQLLIQLLQDPQWEIRARAAKLIGKSGEKKLAHYLESSLKDSVWWVRMNAAEALANLGETGLHILKRQDPTEDQFAYDAATLTLSRMKDNV